MDLQERVKIATAMRALGHDFVAREFDESQLAEIDRLVGELAQAVSKGSLRPRRVPSGATLDGFKMPVPEDGRGEKHQLFSDSIVSGHANPMGIGGELWRHGDHAFMGVTLGKAFEGAPGRAHGGVVAALIDETMGLVLFLHELLAFTAQLDITYKAPTPVNEPITAEAWMASRDGRKLRLECTVQAGETVIASATALFIAVDPSIFLTARQ